MIQFNLGYAQIRYLFAGSDLDRDERAPELGLAGALS